jgi:hypothetical protein
MQNNTTQAIYTALTSTDLSTGNEPPSFFQTLEEPAFNSIINAINHHATERGISDVDAAREVLRVFRKIDALWNQHLIQSSVTDEQKH